eukprot:scaffold55932_cov30-Tisochrysis_lutea.AAC.4
MGSPTCCAPARGESDCSSCTSTRGTSPASAGRSSSHAVEPLSSSEPPSETPEAAVPFGAEGTKASGKGPAAGGGAEAAARPSNAATSSTSYKKIKSPS